MLARRGEIVAICPLTGHRNFARIVAFAGIIDDSGEYSSKFCFLAYLQSAEALE
jgi:hypothetical protein